MTIYEGIPPRLAEMVEMFRTMDRSERIQMLIDIGTSFKDVPVNVASRPFDEARRVPNCESEAFVFSQPNPDGTLKYHFAVENPQGISAKAAAVILHKTLSGAPLEQVLRVPADVMYDIFGRELSMGKNMGLTGMVNFCKVAAAQQFAKTRDELK
ncbi:MAG: SufE family protein [Candidatus Sumerlaeaceae bacterium]